MAVYGYNINFWLDRRAGAIPATYPFTLAVWVYYKNTGATFPTYLVLSNRSTAVNFVHVYAANDATLNYEINGNVDFSSGMVTTATANTWYHICLSAASAAVVNAYVNGVLKKTDNTGVTTLTGMNTIGIGSLLTSTNHYYAADDGLAYAGVWNVALDASEAGMLGKGFPPRQVRPASLVCFADLLAQNTTGILRDAVAAPFALTGSGSTGPYPPPRVRR